MRRSYGRRMIAFLMAFIMALSVLFQSDIAVGGIAQVLAAQSQNVATASDAEKQSDVGDSVATLAADDAIDLNADGYYCYTTVTSGKTYSGKPWTLTSSELVVKKIGDTTNDTKLSSDYYTVEYSNNVNVGTATVTVRGNADMNCSGTLTCTFTIKAKSITSTALFYIDGKEKANQHKNCKNKIYTYQAGGVWPQIYVKTANTSSGYFLTEGTDYVVDYYNNDEESEVVEDPLGDGPRVVVSAAKNSNYKIGSDGEYYIYYGISAANLSDQEISLEGDTFVYTGKPIKPAVKILDKTNNKYLHSIDEWGTNDYEYKVEYTNNTDVGTATVTITGAPTRFKGTVTKTFQIVDQGTEVYSIADADVTVDDDLVYDGTAKTPSPVVKYKGTTLVEGKDYKVSYYTNNTNASTSTSKPSLTISGLGSYVGSKTVNFTIKPRSTENLSVTFDDAVFNTANNITIQVSPQNISVKDKELGTTLKLSQDFSYDFSEYWNAKDYNVGTHKFNIVGIGNYTGTVPCEFQIVAADISKAVITADDAEYTGSEVTTTLSKVKFSNTDLVEGVDYEISGYENNVEIGNSARVMIKGLGNFQGTCVGTFAIKTSKISMNDVEFSTISSMKYTGAQLKPDVTLTYDGKTLVEGTDYSVAYGENIVPGTNNGKVTFTGMGDYAGTVYKSFNILAKSFSDADVKLTVNKSSYEYTGENIKPDITITYNGMTLVEGVNYTFPFSYKETGTWTVIAMSASVYYSGSKSFQITIVAPSGDMGKLTYEDIPDQYYNGGEVKPELTIKNGSYVLKEGTDFTVTDRKNNDKIGTSTITIEGMGSYSGTKVLEFNILPKPLEDCDVKDISDSQYTGEALEPAVTIKNGSVELEQDVDYTVEYSNNTDVTDEAKVVIKAANDNYTGEIVKYFKITPVSIISSSSGMGITQADQSQMYTGMAIEPVINVTRYVNGEIIKLERDKDYTVEYANNIEVTGSGEKASITVTGIGNYTGQKVIRFEIEKRAVYNCQMDAIADQLWTGSAITPEINIYNGEIKLVENEDYTVEYADNTDAGKASVTITGCGDHYTGQIIKYFNITKEFIDISTSDKITLTGLEDQSYNFGMAVRPSFTLSYDGEEMTAGSNGDYTYTFKDNYEVGTATLVITGVGKYKGTKEYTFKIAKYDISGDTLIISGDTFEYSGTAIKPSLVAVKVGTVNRITSFDDFNVTYGENTNVGNGSVTITPKADSSYTGELTQKFVIYKKSITGATVSASSVTYTGKAQTPAVTVTCKDGMAVPSGSYSVEYANNINVGTAKITVTALEDGNFDGTATGSFEIKAIDIAGADVADIADQTYTGSAITPDITVSYDGTELVEGEDYVVSSYDNNENVSTASAKASITITGKGVYSGTKKIEFNIVPASVSKAVVTGVEDSVVYTGADITFAGLAVTVSGRKLTAADYTVKYTNNRNASTTDSKAEILITGKGNYTGEKIVQFVIEQKDIADCTVQPISAQIYTGKAVEPEVTVTDGANTLVKGTDYTVAYSNNINVTTTESKAVADISGTGNYKGSVKATFDIAKKIVKITDADVADIADQTYHMGDKIEPAATVTVDGLKLDADCYTVTYTNNVNVGTATMTVTGITVQGYSGTVEKTFKILPLSIAKAVASKTYSAVYTPAGTTFTVESFDITVDGKKYTVTDMSDFTVTQKNLINVGTGTITVTAKADCNFTGSFDIAATITAAKIEESWASLEQTEFSYTGSEITPEPVVRSGNVILKKDVDYTLSYDSNVECSDKASVMVTGTGNYTGEVKLLFTIGAKSLTGAKVSAQAQSYTGKPLTTKISVVLGDEKLVEGQDYTVEYVEGEVTNAGTGKFKIKGKGNYTGELDGTFVINARSINAEGITVAGVADKTYTGFEITQDITVKDGDAVLTEGTDYTVDYENNVNASTTDSKAAVIVRGKGNYDSSTTRRVEFTIGQKNITDAEIDGVESSVVYTGKAITFDQAVLTVDGVKLVNGVDYETEYVNNLNVSTASSKANIIFSAKGNYTGKASWTFTITAKSIEDCTVSDIPGQTHTGKALTPDITVKDGSRTLVKGTDYDVVYSDNIEVSTADKPAKAVVTGKGNYTGSVQKTFMIAERVIDITPAVISITDKGPFVYNYGKQITPAISVTLDGEVLPEDAYTVSYQSNVNAGKAYIIVTGSGEYHGVIDTSFTIEQLDVTGGVLELEKDAYGYTGSEIKPVVTGITLAGGSIEPGTDFDVTYSNNINVGSGEIALTARSSSNYKGTVTGKFAITAADITDAQLTVADQTYTGAALKPAVTVYLGQTKLIEGTDYTVGYADNTDAGTATVTVKGMGNYAGTVKTTFKIAARSISAAKITVADQVYTGAPLTPEITVTLGGKQIADTEYDVDYSGNTDKGTATVTITGKHNYTGTASETFTISAMDISKCVVSPIASVVYDGTAHSPKVTVKNGEIVLTEGSDYDVTYSDNVSVTTDSRKAKATITGRGNYTGQCVAEFEITKADFADAVITGIPESVEYTGESIVLTGYELTLGDTKLVENQDYVVEYTDNKEIGTATVRFIGAGNYSGEKTAAFKITKADIANCEISPIQGQTWTGKAIEPVLTIKNGSVTLKAGTDYEVTYSNNIDETDEAKAEITGIGNYTGTAVVYFSITRSVVDINGATVSAIPAQTYAFGKAVTPSVTVMYNGITLKENTDYTLTYENNINAGTAYVIITGTKYYSKTKRVSFAINPADISAGRVVIDQESFVYTGKSQKPEVTGIEFGDVMITDMDSFDISFGSNVNVGTASISVSAKSNTNYKGSVTGEFAITEADLSGAAVEVDDVVYQGTPLTPAVRVTLGTVVLTEGRDYTLSYSSNTNVGKGTVKITGSGNYKGTVSAEFAITERTITDADVEVADQIYTGKELTPDVEVTLGDKLLTNGVDYTVTYEKNVNVGTANVIVKGTGNYKDTITKTFRIAAADISSAVAYKISDQTYTGSPITPAVTVSMADGTTLKAGVDYEAEYTGNTDVTTKDAPAQVVITGKGNYVGTLRTTFAIVPKSLTGVAISGYSESVAYTGADVTFSDIIVADGSEILTEGIDYRITYTGNKAVTTEDGTYFTVTGTGNYTGSKDVHFVITAKDLRECDVEEIESQIYTGKAIEPEVTIRNGNVLLVSDVDYDVTYESNINETTETTKAKAIITGKGNYTGKVTKEFVIGRVFTDISKAEIEAIPDQTYTFGQAITPEVKVSFGGKALTLNTDYTVTYTDNIDAGTATVKIIGTGDYNKSVTKTFVIKPADISKASVVLKGTSFTYTGEAITPAVTRLGVPNGGVTESITDLSSFAVEYSDNTDAGMAKVTVSAGKDTNYTGTASTTFTITRKSISGAVVSVADAEYTGSEVIPDVKVTLGDKVLTAGVDYTVSAENNVEAGEDALLKITGCGNYEGVLSQTFEISAKSIDGGKCSIPAQVYIGSALTPDVVLEVGGKTLTKGGDYTVTYADNIDVTTAEKKASAIIKAMGNYTGKLTVYFDITAKTLTAADVDSIDAQEYTGEAIEPVVVVRNGDTVLVAGRDYDVTYSNNTDKTTEARAVVKGKGNYQGTVTKLFEICGASIAPAVVTGIPESAEYTGDSITFKDITVVMNGKTLVYGTDYTVSYENNVNATTEDSMAYVIIKGNDNYGGQIRTAFSITPRSLEKCKVDAIGGQTYTGREITPEVTVRDGSKVLENGRDYTVSYSDNIEVGKNAKAVIEGKGNYTGQLTAEFTIAKEVLDISNAVISDIADQYYNFGEELTPALSVNLGGRKLTENVDYSVTYTDNIEAGTATATVKGIDQNKGEVSKTFKILPIDITTAEIALVKDSYGFTGDAVTADVESITVTRNGVKKVLTDLAGFEITCTDNVNVGTATVKIAAGEGQSYTGSTSTSFRIVAASIEQAEVSVDSAVYTGSAITPVCRVVLGGKTLAEGVDYKVTVSGNVNVTDNALVTIEGTGNYTGKLSQKFSITPKRISQAEVKADDAEYTGSAVTTTVSVVLDGKTLVQGTDYKLSYSDNVNVTSDTAKAVVTVTGTGNYTGTVQGEFSITPMDISKLDIPEIPDQTYGGQAVKPELRIVNGNNVLSEGTDYTVAYENNDSVTDKASAIISGRGSYKGSVTRTFAIKAYSIDNAEISGIQDAVVFTGDAIEFADIAVVVNGRTLVNGTDYTVSYENNLNVTDEKNPAYVIIKGTGNYGGQVRTAFAITAKNIGRCSIDPIGGQIYTGKAVEPEITVRDGARILETGKDYDITYSNNTDVTDSAEVTITGKGNYRGSNSAVFTITQEVVDISKAVMSKVDDQYYNFGNAIRPEVTLTYGGKTLTQDVDYELVYIDNINEGTATIQANGINKNTGSVSTTFAIKPVDITTAEVVLENDSFEYTGSEIRPAVKMITVSRDGKAMAVTSMTAFDVTYTDNTNVGTAGAVIKAAQGSGFTGSVTKKFEITEVDIAQAVVDVEDHVYTGSAVKPAYTVTLDGKKLTAGTDFNVVFSNNVNVGTAAILTVTGTGNYKGTVVAYFAITAKDLSKADVNVQSSVYTGKPLTPAVTVTLDDEILNADIDYVVSYSNNVNATTAKSKATVTVKGTGNYKGTVTATFDIEPKAINEAKINDILDQMYSGSEIRPDAKVTLDGVQLVAGTDYTVTYENNIEVSDSAKLIVTGKGNYKGTVEKNFSIKSLTLEDAEVSGIPAGTEYTGKAITFGEIVVTLVGKKLSEDEDYTVEYKNNVNVTDSAEVVITGIGNYSGELSRTFKITAKDISKCRVDAIGGQVHTGKAVTPEVTVRDGTQVLVSGTDYKTEYSNNINETTASSKAEIKITGSGNYTGSITVNFTISKNLVDISKAVISKISDQLYNFGQPLTPDVTVTFGGKTLVYGEDYALVYVDNIDEGVATVTVRGINSNTGSLSAKFNINPVDISDGQIALDASEYMYTGTAVKPVINSFTVKRAGKTVTVTDFDNLEISYSSNTNVGTGKVTIKALEGEGFTGSVSKTFAIVGASVDNASVKVGNGVYTGEAVTPDHTVTLGGRTLVEGRDYRADYSNNVNVTDSAVLTITGMGNYSGSTTARFKISARNLADADITVASARYTGDPLTPAVTVSLGGTALVEDRDFTVSYSDNVNVTTDTDKAGVTITGIGNYTGTAVEKFDIAARDISLAEIKDIDRQNYTGNAVTPKLTVVDGQRELVAGRDYTVSYKNNVEVTTAAVAVITGKGNYSGTASKLFAIGGADIADADITGIKDSVTYTGKAITFAGLKVTYGDDVLVAGRDYTVSYSGNKNVTDKASVTITGIGNYTGSVNRYFAITRRNLADCHVSEIEGQIYTGKKIEPELTITYGDLVLVEGVDYEIEYSNNIEPTAGGQPAKATVTGKRSYTGTVEREFTITKDPVNISGAKISAIPDQEFAKKNITPAVNVTYGGKTLVQGTDYKVSYINNYNVGTATVTITGYGDYVSSKTATFEIVKRDVTGYVAELSKSSMTYTGKALTPSVTAINSSDGAFVLDDEDIAGFIVRYASNVNVGTATVTATAGSRSNYTGSVTATFAITAASIDNAVVVAEDTEYTGKPVTPAVTVTVNGVVLSAADYTVAYSNNTEVGTAEVSITGKGNYTGETTGTFEITARSIKNCTVECSTSIEYTGNQLIPVVKVKNGDVELTEGVDYILSFDMNTDVTGRAKVVVTGKGNYKDSVTRYFAITKKSIAGAEIKGITGKVFTGNAITQDIEVELDGQKLSQGTDYTVKYENNVHVGTAVITITGAGNYTDSVKKSFVISKADISNTAVINGIESEVIYKGTAFKFDNVTITWGTNVLKEGRDYTITYQNNSGITMTRTSKASVTVKFMGDYKGSVTKQFRIKAFDISKATVSAIADKTYTGSAIKPVVTVKIGRTVINPKEYTVEYSNNVKPGVASVTITGLNNFYGTKKVTFNILPAKVKNLAASGETTTSLKLSWSSSAYAQGYEVYRYDTGKKTYVKVATVTGTSSNITGLAAGTDYKLAVSAYVKSSGKTLYSEKTVINAATKPAKVSGISFSSRAEKSIALKWNTVKGATGYKVYRLVSKDNYKYLGSTSKTAYNVNGLTGSTAYTFKVVAYKKVGSKELVGEDATARIMTTPSAVKNLKISARSNASITMKWSKVNNADGYIVYRYRGNRAVKIKTITSKSKVVFVSSKLSAGTTYKYRVVAYKKDGKAIVENAGTYVSGFTLPATPVVSAKAGVKQAKIAWKRAKGATGYIVYMSTSKRGTYKAVATIRKAGTTSYTKKGLKKGKTYYFKVRAFNKSGKTTYKSSYSTVKKIVVK